MFTTTSNESTDESYSVKATAPASPAENPSNLLNAPYLGPMKPPHED